ncbi:hypothetical protein JVT61DRAFT_7808 [Boletus reticuloceps]|uniref:Uncharacterized protein n=1 Tax=Boletus reticuloceps TaxID=495285 RepID=A0A8I3A5G4_9AGAM|nr:hypothetical protein JVT61DRAFT_7808 [Boletus reticuloceps]
MDAEIKSTASCFSPSDGSVHSITTITASNPSPLSAQNIVPGTPSVDTPPPVKVESLMPSFNSLPIRPSHAQHHKVMAIAAMPSSLQHGGRRPFPPSTAPRVGPGTPFRNSYLTLTPSIPLANNLEATKKHTIDDLDRFSDDEEGREDFEQQEALLYLEVARAWGDVRKLEQKLAQARWDEVNVTSRLYKLQAVEAEKRSDVAERRIGTIRNSICMAGGSLYNTAQKRRCTSDSDDSIIIYAGTCTKAP